MSELAPRWDPGPHDSFSGDFTPLPASADSSWSPGEDGEVRRDRDGGRGESLAKTTTAAAAAQGEEASLVMKLEQLRQWQQLMQEQLRAQQLQELLRLQHEQQQLLQQLSSDDTENVMDMSGAECNHSGSQEEAQSLQEDNASTQSLQEEAQSPEDEAPTQSLQESTGGGPQKRPMTETSQLFLRRHFVGMKVKPIEEEQVSVEADEAEDDARATSEGDRPINPEQRAFEEMLEEQLRLEEQRQQQQKQTQEVPQHRPKRAFLRRGEGLLRFTGRKSANKDVRTLPPAKTVIRSQSEPVSLQRGPTVFSQNPPVQRKTAVVCKDFPSASSVRQDTKTVRLRTLHSSRRINPPQPDPGRTNSQTPGPGVQNCPETKTQSLQDKRIQEENTQSSQEVRDSLERSFQERLLRWERVRQQESVELGEFELLEQAAEELSFSSNSSFVLKVLQMDQQRQSGPRRLSSTPIKSPPQPGPPQPQSGPPHPQPGPPHSQPGTPHPQPGPPHSQPGPPHPQSGPPHPQPGPPHPQSGPPHPQPGPPHAQPGPLPPQPPCESEEDQLIDPNPAAPRVFTFPPEPSPPYDKGSYEDSTDPEEEDEEEERTVTEEPDQEPEPGLDSGLVQFDDHDTWSQISEDHSFSTVSSEEREMCGSTEELASPPPRALTRKVAVSKAAEEEEEEPAVAPSQLMSRLFPALRTQSHNAPVTRPAAVEPCSLQNSAQAQQNQSVLLREKLVELEIQIELFKKENAALTRLRQENQKLQEELRRDRAEFERMKTQELSRFEEHKQEENRKLQKERKLMEKHMAAARAVPNKTERHEIQSLKQQLSSLQEELKRKESRWTNTHNRQRQQLQSLEQDNRALRDEVKTLEKVRLSAWKSHSTDPEKSSAPKGVKFATPLDSSSTPPASARWGRRASAPGAAAVPGMKSSLRASSSSGRRTEDQSPEETPESSPSEPQPGPGPEPAPEPGPGPRPGADCETRLQAPQDEATEGKVEQVFPGGSRLIVFPNGTKKEVSADGRTVKVTFFNGDTKELSEDQRVIYFYAEARTTHITYPDGLEVLHFPNDQTEKHFPDGRKEITFPDQSVKTLFPNGREESVLTDGTVIQVHTDGSKEIHFNTGQREVHTAQYKRREYPDGTVKTVYSDGRQETRYPTGRLRVKDGEGNVILDNRA